MATYTQNQNYNTDTVVPSYRSRLITGSAWNLIAMIFNQGSTFAVNIIIARILGQVAFGEYAIIQNTIVTMASLIQLSFGMTATKYIAEFRTTDKDRAGELLGFLSIITFTAAAFGSIVLFYTSPWISLHALKAPKLSELLVVGVGYVFFSALNGYQTGVFAGLESYKSLAKSGIVSGLVVIMFVTAGACWSGLIGAVWGLSISALVRFLVHKYNLIEAYKKNGLQPRYGSIANEKAIFLKFVLPSSLCIVFTLPAMWAANALLVRNAGFAEMAIYGAANNIRVIVLFLPNVISNVGLSMLNHEKGNGDYGRFNHLFRSNVLSITFCAIITAFLFGLFSDYILRVFGKSFTSAHAISVVVVLLLSTIPESISIAIHQYINSRVNMWVAFFGVNLPREILLVLFAYSLTNKYGAFGMALSYLTAYTVAFITTACIVHFARRKHRNLQQSFLPA